MKKLFLGITTLSLSLFCSAPLWAAPVTPPKPAKNVETRITSDQLTYLAEKQLVIFDKNVHVVRPDIEIWADRITVYLKPPKGDAQKKEGEKGGMPEWQPVTSIASSPNGMCAETEKPQRNLREATYTMDDGVLHGRRSSPD
ncbi:MAG: LptA/OstA family protein [Bilophila wadsworthia]